LVSGNKRLVIFLLLLVFVLNLYKPGIVAFESSKIKGVCIRGDDLKGKGVEATLKKLKDFGYNTIFFLAKTPEGLVYFESKNFPLSVDVFGETVNAAKKLGIKVYAYFPIVMDKNYASKYPSEKMKSIGNAINDYYISLLSENYLKYVKVFIKEILAYEVDGLVFDYIRFPNGNYDFREDFLARAKAEGINIDRVKDVAYKTFVKPADWKTMFEAFEAGDKDIVNWVKLRENIVSKVALELSDYAESLKGNLSIGAFIVSRGYRNSLISQASSISETSSYQVVNFAQEASVFKGVVDFLAPMVYLSNLNEKSDYTKLVVTKIKSVLGEEFTVLTAVNPFEISISETQEELFYGYNYGEGVILFRYPLFEMGRFESEIIPLAGTSPSVNIISSQGVSKQVKIDFSKNNFIPIFENLVMLSPFYIYNNLELIIGNFQILVNGEEREMDVAPFIQNSRTFVPVRFVSEGLNEKVAWNAKAREVIIYGSKSVLLKIGDRKYLVNGEEREMDVAPFIQNSRTFVPVRFVSEALGYEVTWEETLKKVIIEGYRRID